jgi:hypothetical protein
MKNYRDIIDGINEHLEFEFIELDENVDDIMSQLGVTGNINEEDSEEPPKPEEEKEEAPEKEPEEDPTPINLMKDVVNIAKSREMTTLSLGDGIEVKIDALTADKIMDVYSNLNDENRLKFIEMLGKEEATHKKALVFVYKQTE